MTNDPSGYSITQNTDEACMGTYIQMVVVVVMTGTLRKSMLVQQRVESILFPLGADAAADAARA